ncbi:Hydroxymethylglutaryl-coenzyme A reductase, partial [Cooperia oncophora]
LERSHLGGFPTGFIRQDLGGRIPRFSIGDEDCDLSDSEHPLTNDACTQTLAEENPQQENELPQKSLDEISRDWRRRTLSAPDALRLVKRGIVKCRELESRLDAETAIFVRRSFVAPEILEGVTVTNSCCENVIGYVPIPLGVAGPIPINGAEVYVPMATTEGALVASTNRGCSAVKRSGGVSTTIFDEGMTRAPAVKFPTASEAVKLKKWLGVPENFLLVKNEFESTSRFAQLRAVEVAIDGNLAFVRFVASTGDAMGMNMVSKIQGRGRSVVADCILPASVVLSIFKTTPKQMADAAQSKLQSGSDRAVCIGGNNAHAANVVAAIFLATGQDAAQVVSSSMCSTRMECEQTMIGIMLSCAGPSPAEPGAHARRLAEVICSTVLAGELSLMAALVTDQLVSSHMKLNRSRLQLYPSMPAMTTSSVEKPSPFLRKPVEREPRVKRTIKVECSNIL